MNGRGTIIVPYMLLASEFSKPPQGGCGLVFISMQCLKHHKPRLLAKLSCSLELPQVGGITEVSMFSGDHIFMLHFLHIPFLSLSHPPSA